jgi:hypothetical protein
MPLLTSHIPTLQLRERERGAFACTDDAGKLYWVRVFEGTIQSRPADGPFGGANRLLTPEGSTVCHVADDLYLLWLPRERRWVEVVTLASSKPKHCSVH